MHASARRTPPIKSRACNPVRRRDYAIKLECTIGAHLGNYIRMRRSGSEPRDRGALWQAQRFVCLGPQTHPLVFSSANLSDCGVWKV